MNAANPSLVTLNSPPPVAPLEMRCSWCDEEHGVKVIGNNISHRICARHLVSNLVASGFVDNLDTLYYTALCLIAESDFNSAWPYGSA